MKNILAAIFLISSAALPLLAEEAQQALIVEAPATWTVKFRGDQGMQFYSVTRTESDPRSMADLTILIFARSPDSGNVNQIPEQIESLAKGSVELPNDNKNLKFKTDKYKIEEIAGDTFSGRFVQFERENGVTLTIFMIGDTEGIWKGQFTGTKERWTEALAILKSLKKKG
jgi:hypothetical protein